MPVKTAIHTCGGYAECSPSLKWDRPEPGPGLGPGLGPGCSGRFAHLQHGGSDSNKHELLNKSRTLHQLLAALHTFSFLFFLPRRNTRVESFDLPLLLPHPLWLGLVEPLSFFFPHPRPESTAVAHDTTNSQHAQARAEDAPSCQEAKASNRDRDRRRVS